MDIVDSQEFNVNLNNYNGSLNVLLDLAKSQKVNLEDISITLLADQFHSFITKAVNINLELAAEYLVRLRPKINRNPIPALSLPQDSSTLTACGNDYSFDDIFLRPFKALANKNDILICITTSGNSKNILKVLSEANKTKVYSVGFLGKGGGKAKKMLNKSLIVPSNNTARIQECHIFLGHFILEKIEDLIFKKS